MARSEKSRIAITSATALVCITPFVGAVVAQDGAALLTFGLSLNADQSYSLSDEDERELRAGLSVGLTSSTSRHSFAIQAANTLEIFGDETGFRDPSISLNYSRFNADTVLSFDAALSASDVDGETILLVDGEDDGIFDADDILVEEDDGTVENASFTVALETGRTAPFGTESQITYATQTFSGTADPDLVETTRLEARTALRFTINAGLVLRAGLQYSEVTQDDIVNTEQQQLRYSLSGDFRIDPVWSASTSLAFVDGETTTDGGLGTRIVTDSDTFLFNASVSRQLSDGSVGLSYSHETDETLVRDTVTLEGNRTLPRGVEVGGSLALIFLDGAGPETALTFSYLRPLPTGQVTLGLAQSIGVDEDDNNILRTQISGGFSYEINTLSSLSLNTGLTSIRTVGAGADDALSAQFGVSYNRALTEDWDFTAGLRHRVTYDGGDLDDRVSTLSLGLDRRFSIRP